MKEQTLGSQTWLSGRSHASNASGSKFCSGTDKPPASSMRSRVPGQCLGRKDKPSLLKGSLGNMGFAYRQETVQLDNCG